MKNLVSSKSKQLLVIGVVTLGTLCFMVISCLRGPLAFTHDATKSATPIQTSSSQAGHILVQLFNIPGKLHPINATPSWTLYGDGTLLFKSGDGKQFDLQQAKLSPAEVNHILDVIVNQNAFFASSQSFYGQPMADAGSTDLLVDTNGQHKEVTLSREPQSTPDLQTQHVFAIEHFLQGYHPANAQPYVPTGVAILIESFTNGVANTSPWPYTDIKLMQVAALQCGTTPVDSCFDRIGSSSFFSTYGKQKLALFPIYGNRGQNLLRLAEYERYTTSQDNKDYSLMTMPLLPDALVSQSDGSHVVRTKGVNAGNWHLLSDLPNP